MIIDMVTAWKLLHVVGLALGMGAALCTDALLLQGALTRPVRLQLVQTVRFLSALVAVGLVVLWCSGAVLAWLKMSDGVPLLESQRFLTKVAVVAILSINGVLIHRLALPAVIAAVGQTLFATLSWPKRIRVSIIAGASLAGWLSACLLALSPDKVWAVLSLQAMLGLYLGFSLVAALGVLVIGSAAAFAATRQIFARARYAPARAASAFPPQPAHERFVVSLR